jgi:tetratricopeptide (TPR) repeat protein
MFNQTIVSRNVIICALILFSTFKISASEDNSESLMEKGNQHYINKEYQQAINNYVKLISSGYESTELFYNLGNAYYKTGNNGYAILYYEKALKSSPSDEDIIHNLALVNSRLVDKVESFPKFFLFQWWENLLAFFSLTGWTYFSYFLFILLIASILLYFFAMTLMQQKISVIAGSITSVLMILVISLLIVKLNREVNIKSAVIVEQVVTVKLAPDDKSNDAFIIHEGLKVRVEDQVENWFKIRLDDGKIGWMTGDKLRTI